MDRTKYYTLKRVYVDAILRESDDLILSDKDKVAHLTKVLRLKENDELSVFNPTSGEFLAEITDLIGKSSIKIRIKKLIKEVPKDSKISVVFAPIKPDRLRFLIEKCTEIGCAEFIPVILDRSIVKKVSSDKLNSYIVSASEQSGRISVPILKEVRSLRDWLAAYDGTMIFCDEFESASNIKDISIKGDCSVLIGPEGGFTDKERNLIKQHAGSQSVSLGKNILRSETAAIFALSCLLGR